MAIAQPDQEGIDLGQSRIRPADTYVQPARQQVGGDGEALGNALASLGSSFESLGSEYRAKQNAVDMNQTEYYAGQIRNDIKSGAPVDAQVGLIFPDKSMAVRARIAENLGVDAGKAWAEQQMEQIQQDPQLRLDPAAMNARIASIRAQAAQATKGDPGFGSGYLKAVEGVVGQASAVAQAQRAEEYNRIQAKGYYDDWASGTDNAAQEHTNPQLGYAPVGDAQKATPALASLQVRASEGPDSLNKLNGNFAGRLDKMLAAMPPELRQSVTVDSAYRSTEHQQQIYNEELTKRGSAAEARKWAAPPGHSMHNHGEAVDLGMTTNPAAQAWVHEHAAEYGLYFPMAHEPWHIEMVGGYRQTGGKGPGYAQSNGGAAPDGTPVAKASMPVPQVDGPGNASPVTQVVDRIVGAESGGNPGAQNPRSSAGGLGQFTDGTWLASVKKYRPDVAGYRSDADLLAMKKDPILNRSVLEGFTKDNADKLQKQGLPVNPSSLYLMHFAGEGDAPKILGASDDTPVSKVMDPKSLAANPEIANMTVGQIKQWASDKMGAGGADGAARNAGRRIDSVYARSSSLGEQVRRDAIINGVIKHSTETGDTSQLDRVPPEWLRPDDRDRLEQARRTAQDVQYQRWEKQQHMIAQGRAEDTRRLTAGIDQKLISGQEVDPVKDAIGRDGQVNHEALKYAREQQDTNLSVSELTSKKNAASVQDSIMVAASTGQWGRQLNASFKDGQEMRTDDLRDYIANRKDLRSQEKQELITKLPQIMEASNIAMSPTAKDYQTRLTDYAKALQQNQLTGGDLAKLANVNWQGEAEKFYQTEVRNRIRASMEDGEVPRGTKALAIFEAAADRTQTHLDRLAQLMQGQDKSGKEIPNADKQLQDEKVMGKTSDASAAAQAKAPQYTATKSADGTVVVTTHKANTPPALPDPAMQSGAASVPIPLPPSQEPVAAPAPASAPEPAKPAATPAAPTKEQTLSKPASFLDQLEDWAVGKPETIIAKTKHSEIGGEGSPMGDAVIRHQMERLKHRQAVEAEAQRLRDANGEK